MEWRGVTGGATGRWPNDRAEISLYLAALGFPRPFQADAAALLLDMAKLVAPDSDFHQASSSPALNILNNLQ